jgi:hypothetical protein
MTSEFNVERLGTLIPAHAMKLHEWGTRQLRGFWLRQNDESIVERLGTLIPTHAMKLHEWGTRLLQNDGGLWRRRWVGIVRVSAPGPRGDLAANGGK